jgi:hypothetical protein
MDNFLSFQTGILSPVPDVVPWKHAAKALNWKFMALIQEPQDVKELYVGTPKSAT